MANLTSTSLHINVESIAVSVITAIVGVFGLLSNSTAILAIRYNPALRNSFGLLCLSHSIANMSVLLVAVFWVSPITFL
ncbi:hypothetical protein KIN20_024653 [Parelaphostrongylus tenuis]|uniref:7TM GPCR serpentine receptor class x (Srx) domain-containing protein n=1 Tax=Parelaphostrongylus tenuis TaxID=148309 RepID=A0AAD5MTU4_PARTN|nr:hypothetical protein KIN20_024653 [Parelaphostrongylus tenuis]